MEGFSGWIIVLIIAIGVLWEWTNRNFKMHERAINKQGEELARVLKHVDLDSLEMEKANKIHEDIVKKFRKEKIVKFEKEKKEWLEEREREEVYFEMQRKFLEEGRPEDSAYDSLEELEEDLKLFLEESEDRKPHMD